MDARLKTITASIQLITEECPNCGVVFAWPAEFHSRVAKSGGRLHGYCPNGHSIAWGVSEADTLRRERDNLKQQMARLEDEKRLYLNTANDQKARADCERNRANGYKGHATRMTKRVKAGVCPCCNRTFKQLAAHMANKHPEFTPIEIEEGAPA